MIVADLEFEAYLLNNTNKLTYMNNLLYQYDFSEEFLIKSREYYDSWKCLKSQSKLSPYFCFYYLYDREEYDSADNWTSYTDVYDYLIRCGHSDEDININFNKAMIDRTEKND